jgi:hypothetical protein
MYFLGQIPASGLVRMDWQRLICVLFTRTVAVSRMVNLQESEI